MSIVTILVAVIVVCVVLWLVRLLTTAFGVEEPIRTVIFVLVVVLALVYLLGATGLAPIRLR